MLVFRLQYYDLYEGFVCKLLNCVLSDLKAWRGRIARCRNREMARSWCGCAPGH